MIPKSLLKIVPIPPIGIIPNALVLDLKECLKDSQIKDFRFGYMAIDQARHILFLKDEINSFDWCMVGFWVLGIQDITEDCIKKLSNFYILNQVLPKLETGKHSFLICLYSENPRFYQVNYELDLDNFWLQISEMSVSSETEADQNIIMDFVDVDIGRDSSFCSAYLEIFGKYDYYGVKIEI